MTTIYFSDAIPGSGKTRLIIEMIIAERLMGGPQRTFFKKVYPNSTVTPELSNHTSRTTILATPTFDLIHQTLCDIVMKLSGLGDKRHTGILHSVRFPITIVGHYPSVDAVLNQFAHVEASGLLRPRTWLEAKKFGVRQGNLSPDYVSLPDPQTEEEALAFQRAQVIAFQSQISIGAFGARLATDSPRTFYPSLRDLAYVKERDRSPRDARDQSDDLFKDGKPMSVSDQLEGLFRDSQYYPGGLVLMTHEGFAKMPAKNYRSQVSVYFDEARRLVSMSDDQGRPFHRESMKNSDLTRHVLKSYVVESENSDGEPSKYYRLKVPRDFHPAEVLMKAAEMKGEFKTTKFAHLEKFISPLINQLRLAKESRNVVFVPKSAVLGDVPLSFYQVALPSKLFLGYDRVFIFAAYFVQSELFHLLKAKDNYDSRTSKVVFRNLSNHSPTLGLESYRQMRERRDRIISERFSKLRIYPLTASESRPSKYKNSGFWFPNMKAAEALLAELKRRDIRLSVFKEVVMDPSSPKHVEYLQLLEDVGVDTSRGRFRNLKKRFVKKVAPFVESLPDRSRKLQRILREHGETVDTSRCLVADSKSNPLEVDGDPWTLPEGFTVIPQMAHGLNQFRCSTAVLYLRGLNPHPAAIQLLRELTRRYDSDGNLVEYDLGQDLPLDLAIQTLCRTSVRIADVQDTVHVFTMDVWLAKELAKRLELSESSCIREDLMTKVVFLRDLSGDEPDAYSKGTDAYSSGTDAYSKGKDSYSRGGVVRRVRRSDGSVLNLTTTSRAVREHPEYIALEAKLRSARIQRVKARNKYGEDSKQFKEKVAAVTELEKARDRLKTTVNRHHAV